MTRRRIGQACLVLLACLLLSGCSQVKSAAIQTGLAKSPYYHLGDTEWDHGGIEEYYFNQIPSNLNEIYRELYSRFADGEDSADLYAQVSEDDFQTAYNSVLNDHPEFFWIGSSMQMKQSLASKKVVGYQLDTVVAPEDRPAIETQLEAAADACIAGISTDASEYQKIKYVYEYIINTTDYVTDSRDNQEIQSALLYHQSVCAGYARAFQYILHRMGMFCTYVTGTITGGGEHGWNIVRIDGNYYNVDTTWGDPVFIGYQENTDQQRLMNYNYLCVTDADLDKTHTPHVPVPLPACVDDTYNYYRLNGMYYENFDYNTIHQALMNSVESGQSECVMKFGSSGAYQEALTQLFDGGMMQEPAEYLMHQNGMTTWNYSYNKDDEFNLITIYWT